ncbi:hypothetical protein OF83DRAFT_1032888, partial [Amylostereum chailletii]
LKKYNVAAKSIDRPTLEWKDISIYGSLAEFELLRTTCEDILAQPWANSANRQAAIYSLKLERAQEERERLNVEICRLVTWMRDEETQLRAAVEDARGQGSHLAHELEHMLTHRVRQNHVHRTRIQWI